MKLRRTKNGANFIVPIFWATLYYCVAATTEIYTETYTARCWELDSDWRTDYRLVHRDGVDNADDYKRNKVALQQLLA